MLAGKLLQDPKLLDIGRHGLETTGSMKVHFVSDAGSFRILGYLILGSL